MNGHTWKKHHLHCHIRSAEHVPLCLHESLFFKLTHDTVTSVLPCSPVQPGVCGRAPHPGLPQQNDGGCITTVLSRPYLRPDSPLQHSEGTEHLNRAQAAVHAGGRPDLTRPHLRVQVCAGHTECELLGAGVSVCSVQMVRLMTHLFCTSVK